MIVCGWYNVVNQEWIASDVGTPTNCTLLTCFINRTEKQLIQAAQISNAFQYIATREAACLNVQVVTITGAGATLGFSTGCIIEGTNPGAASLILTQVDPALYN